MGIGRLNASIAGVALLLTACSNIAQRDQLDPGKSDELVSLDLVNVLYQVQNLNPASTTLRMPVESVQTDDFAQILMQTLQRAGYSVRTQVSADQSKAVSYAVSRQVDIDSGPVVTYTVHVGDVSVRRSYRRESDGWIRPVAAMQIKGADASLLSINDDIFNRSINLEPKPVDAADQLELPSPDADKPNSQPVPPTTPGPSNAEIMAEGSETTSTAPIASNANPSASTGLTTQSRNNTARLAMRSPLGQNNALLDIVAPGLASADDAAKPLNRFGDLRIGRTANVRDLGQSNFTDILQALGTVEETILTFGDDSTKLGTENKRRVKQVVSQFDPQRDVFSVIGCSHGSTRVKGGQQALALGRALRVKEELQFAGVPDEKILDEGCWASEQFDERMPRRGVVLTLKRRG